MARLAFTFLGLVTLACDPSASSPIASGVVASPLAEPAVRSPGCQPGATAAPHDFDLSVTSSGTLRRALIHLPPSYDPRRPMPLVLNFHSFPGTPELERNLTGMSESADRAGYVVAYPAGIDSSFNAGTCCGDAKRDDVGFTRDLLGALSARICIDPRRIFATGMSNGASFSFRLACEMPDRIAAFAPVSAPMMVERCSPKRPAVPILFFVGTADPIMTAHARELKKPFRNAYEWARRDMDEWAQRNGCRLAPPRVIRRTGDTRFESYLGCPPEAELGLVVVEGGGHSWPGGATDFDSWLGRTTQCIRASDVMWDFFARHPLPAGF
jgi:polyhydroxybutyrate depolymerase